MPESLIVSPMPGETIELSTELEIWGWAWADGSVEVRTGETTWHAAELEPPRGRYWQRFSKIWTPTQRGAVVLEARAEGVNGRCSRSRDGATRAMTYR